MPRPTKFTPEIGESILRLVAEGVPKTRIAPRVGVGLRTLHEWLERGRSGEPAFEEWAARFDVKSERVRRQRVHARFQAEQEAALTRSLSALSEQDADALDAIISDRQRWEHRELPE
ncbi:hypothetical protein BH23PLA1_BH23PLA1_33070 [soil metagenome]